MDPQKDPFAATLIWCATAVGPAVPWPALPPPRVARHERYDVKELIGECGMALVFAAIERETGREVAVKVARRGGPPRADAILQNELAVLGSLGGRGTLPVLDSGTTAGGRPFFVMPRVHGSTLRQLLIETAGCHPRLRNSLVRRRLLPVFRGLAAAVRSAHERGIAHRDLKPGNVLVGGFDEVHLIDWGLSGPIGAGYCGKDLMSAGRSTGGTPGYIAPEALRAGPHQTDARADIWSLGALLYEMLTQRRAVPKGRVPAMINRTLTDTVPRADQVADDLVGGRAMARVLAKALARRPDDRFRTVAAFEEAIDAALAPAETPRLVGAGR